MYEMTHKGAWFKWSTLDRTDKKLLGLSLAAALPPGLLYGLIAGSWTLGLGDRPGGGAVLPGDALIAVTHSIPVLLFVFASVLVSAIAWWRFSLRQDEMFNRVQNHAFGHGSAWTVAIIVGWWFVEQAGLVAAPPSAWWLVLAWFLICAFWFRAARRWA